MYTKCDFHHKGTKPKEIEVHSGMKPGMKQTARQHEELARNLHNAYTNQFDCKS